ncbi:2325_t:CDS:2 [Paraglomus brasilianum]|uniref:2325_t:CDS:1 n=1 Tax=Paraglomus brasilianum TaxID=144538 RepID=A0A9N9CGN5_9GLOM|nr:2325_t:CDS:2 [Paraglomus brasilianum]
MQDSGVPGNPREDVLKEEEKAEEVSKYEVEDYSGDEADSLESARCNESSYAAVAIAVNSMQLKTTNKYSNTTSIKLLASRILKWKRL